MRKMTHHEYRRVLEHLDLTQQAAADFLDISLRQSQAYALGEYPVPKDRAMLLRAMVEYRLKPGMLEVLGTV